MLNFDLAPVGFGKYMKLSAVVVISVNLVAASLSTQSASAADTASFLADALSTPAAPAKHASARATRKNSQHAARTGTKKSTRSYVAMSPVLDGVKVRAFKPGRYLPSEAELSGGSAQYQSMPARLDPAGPMAGNVSYSGELAAAPVPSYPSSYQMSRPASADYMPKVQAAMQKVKQVAKNFAASPRSIPGMNPVLPGQIARAVQQIVPEPAMHQATVQVPQPPMRASMPVQVPQAPQSHVSAAPYVVPPPSLTNYEASRLQRVVDSNLPENVYQQGFNGEMRAHQGNPGLAGGGPSPFPLSVNPMMQARGGRGMSPMTMPVGQQARFGSWHGGSSNLASAAFHSYVPVHMSGPASIKVNHFKGSKKTGRQSSPVATRTAIASHPKHVLHPKHETHAAEPAAASYPPYRRYSS